MSLEYFNIQGVSDYNNPMQADSDGQLIHAVNVVNFPFGALSKRPGYTAFLGTPDTNQVNSLLAYPNQNGTTLYLYRASGSLLYYSQQGTGAWTIAQGSAGGDSGGTITNGNHVGGTIANNILIVGDGAGSTRHTTVGTVFTNTSLAPVSQYFAQFHGRVYTTNGTNSVMSYSVANDASNWNTGGTSDSSSLTVPDEGAAGPLFVAGDRLVIAKTKGKLFNWDDFSLVDMTTKYGPTILHSVRNIDDYWFWTNQVGIFGFDGANKQLLSNPVQRQFYNRQNTGMGTAQIGQGGVGVTYIWDYLVTLGTITDDFTGRQITNALLKYDYQKNIFLNWQFNDNPTAMLSYIDATNKKQLIFGNSSGQCFQLSPTATSDNGIAVSTEMVFLFTYASQSQKITPTSAASLSGVSYEKKWNWIRLFFNPGNEMNIQYAFSNTFTYQHLKWSEAINTAQRTGDYWQVSDGVVEIRFPIDPNNMPRSRFLFLRLYERSDSSAWSYYGCQIDAEPQLIQ